MAPQNRQARFKEIFKVLKLCTLSMRTEEIVESLESYLERHGDLTPKQEEMLFDIYERSE